MIKRVLCFIFIWSSFIVNGQSLNMGRFCRKEKTAGITVFYELILRSDSSFSFSINVPDANPKCEGIWKFDNDEYLLLECEDLFDPSFVLSSGYMSERNHRLKIKSKNRIIYKGMTLRRIKDN